ncbi:MFS transporter [soil metagenome]
MTDAASPNASDAASGAKPGDSPAAAETPKRRRSAMEVARALTQPKVALMLALGLSSGLPFMLVGNTLNYWLGDAKVDLALVGFASWVGFAYTFKFIIGALVDNVSVPFLGRLGRRRGWMLPAQILVAIGLLGMATTNPGLQLSATVAFAVVAAVGSAAQDTVIDAWRIESAADAAELDLLTSAYSLGYRIAMILTASVILYIASALSWPASYAMFGVLMGVGVVATLLCKEPARADQALNAKDRQGFSLMRIVDVVVGPFVAFFRQVGWAAALILLVVTTYHLCDYLRGPVINPFYGQVGLQKPLVASVRLAIGIPSAIIGITAGGLFAARFGRFPALMVGGILQPLAVAAFAILAWTGPNPVIFSTIMAFDDLSMSFAGVVLISYISTLTSLGYTATQYALLTSALAFAGKTLKGFSGVWVKGIAKAGGDLTHAYATYFLYCSLVAIPALLLVMALAVVERRRLAGTPATI